MNNKGLTLVELLAVIAIIGILSGTAIMMSTQYVFKSREEAYEKMKQSTYSAATNYYLDEYEGSKVPDDKKRVSISTLVSGGYLEKIKDPNKKGSFCAETDASYVEIDESNIKSNDKQLDTYKIKMKIICSSRTIDATLPE